MRIKAMSFLLILNFGFYVNANMELTPAVDEELSERTVSGVYEVPVPENLKDFAFYPVMYNSDSYQENPINPDKVTFNLPATLVGEEKVITLTKIADQEGFWSGPNANADCSTIERNFKCNVVFKDLEIDPHKQEIAIRENFKTEAEIVGRLQVARHFSGEPIGIISYKLHGSAK